MKMDVFCADIADSLDMDASIQNMRTFCNWKEDWQQPSQSVGPRGDAVLVERLKKNFLGIKLIYKEKLFSPPNLHLLTLIGKQAIRVSRCRFGGKIIFPAKPTFTHFPRRVSRCRFGGRKIILPPNLHLLIFQEE
jgi:hypothetical protein